MQNKWCLDQGLNLAPPKNTKQECQPLYRDSGLIDSWVI